MGVSDQVQEFKVYVLPFAHDWVDDNAADPTKLPTVAASQKETCDNVSVVPPFVHDGFVPVIDIDPAAGADQEMAGRVVEPAAAAVAPDAPGSPVCSFTNTDTPVNVVPRRTFNHAFARFTAEMPTVTIPAP